MPPNAPIGLSQWLVERPTPLLWVSGPVGSGKTTAVETELRGAPARAAVLRLSAFGPDDAYSEIEAEGKRERLTTKALLRLATDQHILVIESLDVLQQAAGQRTGDITDCRFRQLLLTACHQALPAAAIIVTSRLAPPDVLPEGSLTVIDLPEMSDPRPRSSPESGSLERRVLEFAALSPRAIDSATIQHMSGIEETVSRRVLSDATKAGLVTHVGRASYQVFDFARSSVLSDTTRINAVRKVAIEALQQGGGDLERLLSLLVDHGDTGEAVMVYWHSLGNYGRLHHEGRDHLGAQLCRRLNDGLGPDEVSPKLRDSEGAWAVMNDWSQFALSCGDAGASALAAASAYRVLPEDRNPGTRPGLPLMWGRRTC